MKIITVLSFLTVLVTSAYAQDPPGFREKIQSLKKKKLIEELSLSREKSDAFLKLYDDFSQRERDLHQQRRDIFVKLVHMSALGNDISGDVIVQTIEELNATEQKIHDHHVRVVKEFRSILNPSQIAKMIVFEQNFQNKMRNIVIDVRGKRHKMKQFLFEGEGAEVPEFDEEPY